MPQQRDDVENVAGHVAHAAKAIQKLPLLTESAIDFGYGPRGLRLGLGLGLGLRAALTAKVSPTGDWLVINDAEDGKKKKKLEKT